MIHLVPWLYTFILVSLMFKPTLSRMRSQKNVLMIIADDLRPQFSCQTLAGTDVPYMHTPNICYLASKSLHFMENHAPMALCSPSRTATLTGRSVGTTHVWDLVSYFRNVTGNLTTIPQFFKDRGYRTTGIGKIFHEGASSGWAISGDYCPVCTHKNQDQMYSWSDEVFEARKYKDESTSIVAWKIVPDDTPLQDTLIMQHAVEVIKSRGEERDSKPFFIAVGFHKPHLPFVVPQKFYDFYKPSEMQLPPNPNAPVNMPDSIWEWSRETWHYKDVKATGFTGEINETLPDFKTLELRRGYYAAVSFTDYNVGRVLSALSAAGLDEDTITIFWGDHGYSLGEHGRWDKHSNFDTDTHCPFMIRVPGLTDTGSRSYQLTGLIDMFPTLVELVFGKEVLENELPYCPKDSGSMETCREGVSLVPLLYNPNMKIHNAISSMYGMGTRPYSLCLFGHQCKMGYSLQTFIDDKLYRYTETIMYRNLTTVWDEVKGVELYDRSSDPGETYNMVNDISDELLGKFRLLLRESLWSGSPL